MAELIYNNQAGNLVTSGTDVTNSTTATAIHFMTAPNFQTIVSPNFIKLELDPGTTHFEIVYLTAYTQGQTSGTVTRAAEDATNWPAAEHPSGTWVNAPSIADFTESPLAATATQYVTSTGNDNNDGLTWNTAKLTINAANTAIVNLGSIGGVIQIGYGNTALTSASVAEGVVINGLGMGVSTLKVSVDAGAGHYALNLDVAGQSGASNPTGLTNLTFSGPGTTWTVGVAPANMYGAKTGSKSFFENVYFEWFYAPVVIARDAEKFTRCFMTNNYYGVYCTSQGGGDQAFINCDLTGNTFTSVACSGGGSFDYSYWASVHLGFSPLGMFKETQTSNNNDQPAILSNSWVDVDFEGCGNACIYDETPSASVQGATLYNVEWVQPNWAIHPTGAYSQYYYSGLSASTAAVNIAYSTNLIVYQDNSAAAGAGYITYQANYTGANSFVSTDKAPQAYDFAGKWNGSIHRPDLTGIMASIANANGAILAGQVLEYGDQAHWQVFGTSSNSFAGFAAYAQATTGAPVACVTAGYINILCTNHITAAIGCLLEIDPATPTQVRVVNQDQGAAIVGTTQAPSIFPIVAVSQSTNSGANTVVPATINSPYYERQLTILPKVSVLPTASATNQGQPMLVPGGGSANDTVYVCVENSSAVYSWQVISTSAPPQVTFGTPVAVNNSSSPHSPVFAMSGVTSGQPIGLMLFSTNGGVAASVSDTFATPYTWTQVDLVSGAIELWIGTGGVGTSGSVTAAYSAGNNGGCAIPFIGASTASGLGAVDVHAHNSGTGGVGTLSMTPTAMWEGAFYAAYYASGAAALTSPWNDTSIGSGLARADTQSAPSPASALATNWGGSSGNAWYTVGMIVKI